MLNLRTAIFPFVIFVFFLFSIPVSAKDSPLRGIDSFYINLLGFSSHGDITAEVLEGEIALQFYKAGLELTRVLNLDNPGAPALLLTINSAPISFSATGELGNYWTTVTVEVREDVIIKRHLNEESPTPFTATTWAATDTITGPYESKYEDTMDAVIWAIRELLLWHAKANRR